MLASSADIASAIQQVIVAGHKFIVARSSVAHRVRLPNDC